MTVAVCPGSFDPITFGHVDVVKRARALFDHVVIAVGFNATKHYLFTQDERIALAQEAVRDIDGVEVVALHGLISEFCRSIHARAIVKGLRGAADYDGEQAMALMNRHLTGIETVFVMGDPQLGHVASSLVKDVANNGGNVRDLVPAHIARALEEKRKDR